MTTKKKPAAKKKPPPKPHTTTSPRDALQRRPKFEDTIVKKSKGG